MRPDTDLAEIKAYMAERRLSALPEEVAATAGFSFYFTGEPCRRGHVSLRRVGHRECIACKKMRNRNNPPKKAVELKPRRGSHIKAVEDYMLSNGLRTLSKDVARAQGLKYYFTGEPCAHGHVAMRRSDLGRCLTCYIKVVSDLQIKRKLTVVSPKSQRDAGFEAVEKYMCSNGLYILSKEAALAEGLEYYFTGEPCPHSHMSMRRVDLGRCVECYRNKRKLAVESPKSGRLSKSGRMSKTERHMAVVKKYMHSNGLNMVSKETAIYEGFKFYFLGEPCARGHLAFRRARNGACDECCGDVDDHIEGEHVASPPRFEFLDMWMRNS